MKKWVFLFTMSLFMVTSMFAESQKTTITIDGATPKIETTSDNAAAQTATNLVADSTKLTVSKIYNDMKAGVAGMAKALKAPAEHVYMIMCKQQVVTSITYLLILCILWLVTIVLVSVPFWAARQDNKTYRAENPDYKGNKYGVNDNDDDINGIGFGGGLAFGIVSVIVTICMLNTIVSGFVNPEYGAIKDIIGFFN